MEPQSLTRYGRRGLPERALPRGAERPIYNDPYHRTSAEYEREFSAVAGGEGRHARGVGVELLLVEDGEVVRLDVAETDLSLWQKAAH